MERIFEGRTEREAIDAAVEALGIEAEEIEIEILESQGGLLGMGKKVRILVHLPGDEEGLVSEETATVYGGGSRGAPVSSDNDVPPGSDAPAAAATAASRSAQPETDFEHAVVDFVTAVTGKLGFPASVQIMYRRQDKIGMRLDSDFSNILIGRKGKNLDALQLLANVVASRIEEESPKIILDAEGYRARREESLIRLAHKVGDQVMRTRRSKLLEPMNPFERRLIHTTLNDIEGIRTESEGEGLYKQVRVIYRDNP